MFSPPVPFMLGGPLMGGSLMSPPRQVMAPAPQMIFPGFINGASIPQPLLAPTISQPLLSQRASSPMPQRLASEQMSLEPPQVVARRPITREELVSEGRIIDGSARDGSLQVPIATNFIDVNRDGHANLVVMGIDSNRDGIVDALQQPGIHGSRSRPLSTTPGLPYVPQRMPMHSSAPSMMPRPTIPSPMSSFVPPVVMSPSPMMSPMNPASAPMVSPPMYGAPPMAANFLDMNGNGRPDLFITGADRNKDGVVDALQQPFGGFGGQFNGFGQALGRTISNQPGISSPMPPSLFSDQPFFDFKPMA